jgi:hypothetical protein
MHCVKVSPRKRRLRIRKMLSNLERITCAPSSLCATVRYVWIMRRVAVMAPLTTAHRTKKSYRSLSACCTNYLDRSSLLRLHNYLSPSLQCSATIFPMQRARSMTAGLPRSVVDILVNTTTPFFPISRSSDSMVGASRAASCCCRRVASWLSCRLYLRKPRCRENAMNPLHF